MTVQNILALCPPASVHHPLLVQGAAQIWPCEQAMPADWLARAGHADALLLLADVVSNCRVARQVGAAGMAVPLLAAMQHRRLAEYKALLRVGVDLILPAGAAPGWLAAALAARVVLRSRPAGHLNVIDGWRLSEDGWWLSHAGRHMRLSVIERVLVQALFDAPGHVLRAEALQQALHQETQGARLRLAGPASLRHQFSRLRARQARLGALPIEALSHTGYIWA
ncbi:hypothetical protein [Castellaniella sp.]|uniref:hypothetical protein n=1 Tax=Castellaniella sp. TaxID=1955812 RepID=UPI00356616C4